jgi:hypothetical protein
MAWGFRNHRSASYPHPMAHRSHIIAVGCEVALDRRVRGDDAKVQAARERVGGTEADMAAAEWWVLWAIAVGEEIGVQAVRDVLQRHRLVGILP